MIQAPTAPMSAAMTQPPVQRETLRNTAKIEATTSPKKNAQICAGRFSSIHLMCEESRRIALPMPRQSESRNGQGSVRNACPIRKVTAILTAAGVVNARIDSISS